MKHIKYALDRLIFKQPKVPKTVQINPTNRCNLDCKMCQRRHLKVKYEHIDYDLFKSIVDKLNGVEEIILTGWGEPMVHPKIYDMVKYAKNKGFIVRFTTNGTLLTKDNVKRLVDSDVDTIFISLDSTHPTESGHENIKFLDNIEYLVRNAKNIEINFQPTLHKDREQDVRDVIDFASKIGVRRVQLLRLVTHFDKNIKRPSVPNEEKPIFNSLEKYGKGKNVSVDFVPYALFDGFSRFSYKILRKSLHKFGKYCPKLFDGCYITWDGNLTPCCLLPHYTIVNMKDVDSIEEAWNDPKFKDFRENKHSNVCSFCDAIKIF